MDTKFGARISGPAGCTQATGPAVVGLRMRVWPVIRKINRTEETVTTATLAKS